MRLPRGPALLAAGALALAGASGFLASKAIGVGQQAPTETVTVDVGGGATGPAGPAGPPGPAGPKGDPGSPGAEGCPVGSSFKAVKLVQQAQGPTTIWVCVAA